MELSAQRLRYHRHHPGWSIVSPGKSIAVRSWGRYFKYWHYLVPLAWPPDHLPSADETGGSLLPFGLGASYGDSCLNENGGLLLTRKLDRLISFDRDSGLLRCEAGITFEEILKIIVPQGWFLPVVPGTKLVTVGGAIANDIHGKNHHRTGNFGNHVPAFGLLRSDGSKLVCSQDSNTDWFQASIGGLGLTGLITWAEIQLIPIETSSIEVETVKLANLDEFFTVSAESDQRFDYTVSWLDCLAKGPHRGRGVFIRGNHVGRTDSEKVLRVHREPRLMAPFNAPDFLLNSLSIRMFNTAYYANQKKKSTTSLQPYASFFFPLDSVRNWNRIYGRRGFFQYQFVVPFHGGKEAVARILDLIAESRQGSFLAVMKTFGEIPSRGILSFPRPGITLALDFPNRGIKTLRLFNQLDRIVAEAGGRLYPAKDSRMSGSFFRQSFPEWESFSKFIDPAFSSSFWRRVSGE